jgi:hypothetical protein
MILRRLIVLLGGSAAIIVAILILNALLLPRLIDSQWVREKIGSLLAEKTRGNLTLGKIALQWFPRPIVVIDNAAFSFDNVQGTIQAIVVYPSISNLFRGRVVVHRLRLQEPRVNVRLPARSQAPFVIKEWEENIRAALAYVATELPALRVELSDGSAEITMVDKAPVTVEDVNAQALGSTQEVNFRLSARSNLCAEFRFEGRISQENLASQSTVAIRRLKLEETFAFLPFQFSEYARKGEASFDLKVETLGLRQIKAEIDGSVDALVLARRGGIAKLDASTLKGTLTYEDGSIQANLGQLELASPRLRASGELTSTPLFASARIQFRGIDVAEIRDLALRTADDLAGVQKLFQFVQAGAISEMLFESRGPSFLEMAVLKNLMVSGMMRNAKVIIPERDLELTNVSASVRLLDAVLEANDLAGNLGTTRGWDGKLRLGLEGKTPPFHLDMAVQANAAELQAALLKLVDQGTFRSELLKVHDLAGELSGRVILGERLGDLSSVVSLSKSDVSAFYEPIPYPIVLMGGRFAFDPRAIRLENVHGLVGRSILTGFSAILRKDQGRGIGIDAGQISLDLEEAERWLRRFEELRPHFGKLQSARGRLEIESLSLSGALDDPAKWNFTGAGAVKQVVITHADLPGPLNLSRGKFAVTQERITFSDVALDMLDASVITRGVFESARGSPLKLEAGGTAMIGAQAGQWLSRRIELPKELVPRYPLTIAAERIAWQAPGDVSLRGQATVASGAQIFLDVTRAAQSVAAGNFTVQDGARRAQMTFQLDKDNNVDLSFKGALAGETLDHLFASFPLQAGSLQGDFQASASLTKPVRFSAHGELAGSQFALPLRWDQTRVEAFRIEADGANVLVRGAELRLGKSRLKVSGQVAGENDALRLDMDVHGDRLDWEDLKQSLGGEGDQRADKVRKTPLLPPLEGTVRLKTDSFIFQDFDLNPLQITAVLASSGIRAEIDQAVVCGIAAAGRVDLTNREIDLDVQLAATEAQLEPATVCLSSRQQDIKGIYSLKARVSGRGERAQLLAALKGKFEISARDGEFVGSPGIDATFDYLNATGDFKVAFPDLNKETFPYRLVSVKGSIDGGIIAADEIVVNSSLLNLSGQAKIDVARKQIDGKVLIAVLKPVDEVLSRIPVVSSIFGGSLIGIPVRVAGALERPEVTYLSPADVGAELLNIPVRILGIPLGAMRLFAPGGDSQEKNVTQ